MNNQRTAFRAAEDERTKLLILLQAASMCRFLSTAGDGTDTITQRDSWSVLCETRRALYRLVRAAELHGRSSLLHYGPNRFPHGHVQGPLAGCKRRAEGTRCHHRHVLHRQRRGGIQLADGGTTPFRGEMATNWEGGFRVPCAIRWPGVIEPGTVSNEIFSHEDMLPTILAAAGVPDVKEQLLKGMKVGDKTFKVHLDGYDITDALAGKSPNPRHEFFYFNDDGSLVGLRYDQWKVVFAEQRAEGFDVWQEPFTMLRLPKVFNLRSDPFELADHESIGYPRWRIDRVFLLVPAQEYVGKSVTSEVGYDPISPRLELGIDHRTLTIQFLAAVAGLVTIFGTAIMLGIRNNNNAECSSGCWRQFVSLQWISRCKERNDGVQNRQNGEGWSRGGSPVTRA